MSLSHTDEPVLHSPSDQISCLQTLKTNFESELNTLKAKQVSLVQQVEMAKADLKTLSKMHLLAAQQQ